MSKKIDMLLNQVVTEAVNERLTKIENTLIEHEHQIERRPVNMEHIKNEIYWLIEKLVTNKLNDHAELFDSKISHHLWSARLVPEKEFVNILRDDAEFKLRREDE